MAKDEWEIQKELKYRDHDFALDDIPDIDMLTLKSQAIRKLVDTAENNPAKAVIASFMAYLTKEGFRITKKDSE